MSGFLENKSLAKYLRTDLATECYPPPARSGEAERTEDSDGLICTREARGGADITRLDVRSESGAAKIGKPVGSYVTADIGAVWRKDEEERGKLCGVIADELRGMLRKALGQSCFDGSERLRGSALIVGLGNRKITSDALGPLVTDGITVTRHIRIADSELFSKLEADEISALAPGVAGQTGIETAELIRVVAGSVRPSVIIAIDALAARSPDRLGTTVQLCDTGISPGSGIGNLREAINSETTGVPVIAIGVPTIVDSATIILDALEKSGLEDPPSGLEEVLHNGKSYFVTLKESDEAVSSLSSLISDSLSSVFGLNFG